MNEGAFKVYIDENTFMIIPPVIIRTMARIAGKSGFCLYKIIEQMVTPTMPNPHHNE